MGYFFDLPKIDDLTQDQEMALDETKSIAISGGAGTGKTVVSLWRHIYNIKELKKLSVLITYTKTLTHYLSMNLSSIESKYRNVFNLKTLSLNNDWIAKEIIIDEAQDLTFDKLQEIKNYADIISYGADFNQKLYRGTVTKEQIEELFPDNVSYNLQQNFRNTFYILDFVKSVLPNFYIPQSTVDELEESNKGIKPIMFITNSFEKEIDTIIEIINEYKSDTHNIAILLPFGDNSYDRTQSVDIYYNALSKNNINSSKYYNKMQTDNITIENVHITTFKSSKGLEFDTVIIPKVDKYTSNINNAYTVNEEDYYVAFTRAKRNLFLISNEELEFIDSNTVEIENLD